MRGCTQPFPGRALHCNWRRRRLFFGGTCCLSSYIPSTARIIDPSGPRRLREVPKTFFAESREHTVTVHWHAVRARVSLGVQLLRQMLNATDTPWPCRERQVCLNVAVQAEDFGCAFILRGQKIWLRGTARFADVNFTAIGRPNTHRQRSCLADAVQVGGEGDGHLDPTQPLVSTVQQLNRHRLTGIDSKRFAVPSRT